MVKNYQKKVRRISKIKAQLGIEDVDDENGLNCHQYLKVVANAFRLQTDVANLKDFH